MKIKHLQNTNILDQNPYARRAIHATNNTIHLCMYSYISGFLHSVKVFTILIQNVFTVVV